MDPLASFLQEISFQNYVYLLFNTAPKTQRGTCPLNPAWIQNKGMTTSQYCPSFLPQDYEKGQKFLFFEGVQ